MESYGNHDRYSFIHNNNCGLTFLIPANSLFKVKTKLPNSHARGGFYQRSSGIRMWAVFLKSDMNTLPYR